MELPAEQLLQATLQAQEWNIVLAGLNELPAKYSYSVIAQLKRQFDEQALRAQHVNLAQGVDNGGPIGQSAATDAS